MKPCLFVGFVAGLMFSVLVVSAQQPPRNNRRVVRLMGPAQLNLPPVFFLRTLTQRLSPEDSLNRGTYARNRVRTVTMLRQASTYLDTTDFIELDRRGNKIRIDHLRGITLQLQRFDKQNRLIELMEPEGPTSTGSFRTVYDPQTKVTTSFVKLAGRPAPLIWQQAQSYQRGDTLTIESIFQPIPGTPQKEKSRMLVRSYPVGGDTVRTDVTAYDAADQPTSFSASYAVRRQGLTLESGKLAFGSASAPEVLRLSHSPSGRYVPQSRYEYNQRGQLIKSVTMADYSLLPARLAPQTSANGQASLSMSPAAVASTTTRYLRTPDGRVLREDLSYQLLPGVTDPNQLKLFQPTSKEYTYGTNGLLLRTTDYGSFNGQVTVYEVKYTYF